MCADQQKATYKWQESVVTLLLAFEPPSSPDWDSRDDIGHIPILRPLSLLSKGKEQTLISMILFVYLEPSGGYLFHGDCLDPCLLYNVTNLIP